MNTDTIDTDLLWNRYRNNFSRHMLGVARYVQHSVMNTLQEQCGHRDLRLSFSPYIHLLRQGDMRLSELADILGISRQACNQAVKQVEAAGYITRTADPDDGRAKQLTLSKSGRKLSRDGERIVTRLDQHFAQLVGKPELADTGKSLDSLTRQLSPRTNRPHSHSQHAQVGALLARLSDYIMRRLMELNYAKGHTGLKLSFAQVLTMIGPQGGRIQQMAAAHDVSKQAISAIATELEALGYLQRQADPLDARQLVLQFTPRGQALIADSVASVDQLEQEFGAIIGSAALKQMKDTLYALYRALQLEQDIFDLSGTVDIALLARQLRQQLGTDNSRALAELLLQPATNPR
ncbi:MAG: MarR family transcriptional regulator [Halioglobus sp.]|nr:MarR family transcriptional regulator [Halioglobus sp.]